MEAIAYVVSLSPMFKFLAPILRWQGIMAVGTKFYETIANNRPLAGKLTAGLKFRPLTIESGLPLNIIVLLLLAYTTIWNGRSFVAQQYFRRNAYASAYKIFHKKTFNRIDWISRVTRLDQSWSILLPDHLQMMAGM